jgi:hypothetical protein
MELTGLRYFWQAATLGRPTPPAISKAIKLGQTVVTIWFVQMKEVGPSSDPLPNTATGFLKISGPSWIRTRDQSVMSRQL